MVCEYDEEGIKREYVQGVSMKEDNQKYYYIYDRLGNVRYVLDSSGAIVKSYSYSPFGQIHSSSGSLSQPYQFVGGEFYWTEEDIGLYLLGQRWYDAEVGRFISRDPIEGGLNLYVYVRNNCVNRTDADGLKLINISYTSNVLKCLSGIVRCASDPKLSNAVFEVWPDIFLDTEFNPDYPSGWTWWPWFGFGKPQIAINLRAWGTFDEMCLTITHELVHVAQGFIKSRTTEGETEAGEKVAEEYFGHIKCCIR